MQPRERRFIGRDALEAILSASATMQRKLVGLILEERGVLRSHQKVVVSGVGVDKGAAEGGGPRSGEITSGTFSPTLERSIALARVPAATAGTVQVDIRGKLLNARVVKPPFVRGGKAMMELPEKP